MRVGLWPACLGALGLLNSPVQAQTRRAAPETIASFSGPMQTGVTVSHTGRIFVNFPHWGDPVRYTVAEVRNGRTVPYPNAAINRLNKAHPERCLVSVQSVVVDPRDRLWMLDTGSIKLTRAIPGGPKMVCVDLKTNKVVKTILFPSTVALPTTYLNDVRFDLRRGHGGFAYITDSGEQGPNGIIVVDLDSGRSWRRLSGHPSVRPEPKFVPVVEGQPLMQRRPGNAPKPLKMGSDGIALSADGKTLYYCPLASRHLYGVSTDALTDRKKSEAEVAATVQDLGLKPPSDGLEFDAEGNLYATDYEHARVVRGKPGGPYRTVAQLPTIYWPDTLSVASGYLYISANELQRQGSYHNGKDLRVKPYHLYRVRLGAAPVSLK